MADGESGLVNPKIGARLGASVSGSGVKTNLCELLLTACKSLTKTTPIRNLYFAPLTRKTIKNSVYIKSEYVSLPNYYYFEDLTQ